MQKPTLLLILLILLASACPPKNPVEKTDAVRFIDPSLIRVEGELNTRLMKNFDRLESGKYRPDSVFMSEATSNWWPGDKEGRTILALTKLAQATGREPKYLDTIIKLLPVNLNMPQAHSLFITMPSALNSAKTVDLVPIIVPAQIHHSCILILTKPIGAAPCAAGRVWLPWPGICFTQVINQCMSYLSKTLRSI